MTAVDATGAEGVIWDLSDLYASPSDPALEADGDEALAGARRLRERYAGRLTELEPAAVVEVLQQLERIAELAYRVWSFAELSFSADTHNPDAARLLQRAEERRTAVATELRFFDLEWSAADDDLADEVLAQPSAARYREYLNARRSLRPHLLSQDEERVAAEKSLAGTKAWQRLHSKLTAELRVDFEGEELPPFEATQRFGTLPERGRREALARAMGAGLEPNLLSRAAAVNAVIADRVVEDRLRGYATWLSHRNLHNRISDDAVDALCEALAARIDIPERHFHLRARLLGLDRLADYDRTAPVNAEPGRIPWAQARELVCETYAAFSPTAGEIVRQLFEQNRIEAEQRDGKTSGAFCFPGVPGVHPYVFLTYSGTRRGAAVLAHELGHAVHGALASEEGFFNVSFDELPLTVAETASVLGESLMYKALLDRAETSAERLALLVERLDDALYTSYGAIAAHRFEDALHAEYRAEGELDSERIGELWVEAHERYFFGDAMTATPEFAAWWSFFPHFVALPGYLYAYAFGYLLSLSLYGRYLREGDALVEPIFTVLRAGGAIAPGEFAEQLGLSLDDPRFWDDALDVLDGMVGDAEALATEA